MKQQEQKEIIEKVLKEFVEKHELNLKNIGGWDRNDFIDYSTQLLERAIQSKEKEMLDDEIMFINWCLKEDSFTDMMIGIQKRLSNLKERRAKL